MPKYFAYGSNLSHQQMAERCPESVPTCVATLYDYTLTFSGYSEFWKGGGAAITHSIGSILNGGLYEVSDADLHKLDKFESAYRREEITVFTDKEQKIQAITYIKLEPEEFVAPSERYVLTILKGHLDFNITFRQLSRILLQKDFFCNRLFVYGTLRVGGSNHDKAVGFSDIQLADLMGFEKQFFDVGIPFLSEMISGAVKGDLLEYPNLIMIQKLELLDRLEGFNKETILLSFYERTLVPVLLSNGDSRLSWVYIIGKKL